VSIILQQLPAAGHLALYVMGQQYGISSWCHNCRLLCLCKPKFCAFQKHVTPCAAALAQATAHTLLFRAALRRTRHSIPLGWAGRPGVWLIEAVASGQVVRARIQKGSLRMTQRPTAAGQVLTILDEGWHPVKVGV
jgi:hypothetical protein